MAEGKAPTEGTGPRAPRLRVVVVEPPTDGVSKLELLTAGQRGVELAAHANSASEALGAIKTLSSHRGAAAIVSLALPGPRDAFWLIRSIRDRFPTLSILACHTGADETTISRAFFAGADGYIDTTAGAARFLKALRQVVAGELSLLDSSTPEPEVIEEEQEEESPTPEEQQSMEHEEQHLTEEGPEDIPVPAPPQPGVVTPSAVVTERILPEKARRRWFGTRKERRTHPAPEPPTRVAAEEPPKQTAWEEPGREEPAPEPKGREEPAPEPKRRERKPPEGFQPPIRLEPVLEAQAGPTAPAETGPEAATETVWAPGAEWDAALEEQVRTRFQPAEPPPAKTHDAAPETVWADEREIVVSPPPEVVAQPAVEPEPEAIAEPEPEPQPEPEPEAEPEPEPEPEIAALVEPEPEPVAIVEPEPEPVAIVEPEPEPQPEFANIVAVGPSAMLGRDLARLLHKDPGDILRLPSVPAAEGYLADHKEICSVLIASADLKEADALGLAEFASWRSPTTAVVLVRQQSSDKLLQKAMRAGVREVVEVQPGSERALAEAVERALAWSEALRSARREPGPVRAEGASEGVVVSIFSSKGGTGKTFLASNLAAAVASRSGKDTAILDLDLEAGDVFSYFGQEPRHRPEELMVVGEGREPADVLRAGAPLETEVFGYAAHSDSGGGTQITTAATEKLLQALRQTFAYTIVDCSASYSDHALTALELSDRICLISALDVTAVRHLSRALDTLQALGLPSERLLFVLNRADSKVDLSPTEVEEVMKVRVDARIPSSALVPISLNKGRPIVLDVPSADVSKAIGSLADQVVALQAAEAPTNGKGVRRRS